MSQIISLFPTYEHGYLNIFSLSDYEFFYEKDGEVIKLDNDPDNSLSGEIVLEDNTGYWSPDEYSLNFSKKIEIVKANLLYEGISDTTDFNYKIACANAVIGIGLVWSSPSSNQKGAFVIGDIKKKETKQVFSITKSFPKGLLRGEIIFSVVLFIRKPGTPKSDEYKYANEAGCKIGEVENYVIRIDGNGSFFPMKEVDKPGENLWSVECNWTDPAVDSFADSVTILLNRCHKNFKYLDRNNQRDFQPQLLIEILAGAVGNVIETFREEDKNFMTLQDAQEGSVALALKYFNENLEWDISSPIKTSASIRKFLEQKLLKI